MLNWARQQVQVTGVTMKTLILTLALVLCACPGARWFPTCKEPGSQCPPVDGDPVPYPTGSPFARGLDAGARDASAE